MRKNHRGQSNRIHISGIPADVSFPERHPACELAVEKLRLPDDAGLQGKEIAMLTSQRIIDAINEQIGNEFSAMLQYFAISAHFDAETLPGLCEHFAKQAEEEKEHAIRFIRYVTATGARVSIPAIPAGQCDFKNAEEAVALSLEQEKRVTAQINAIVHMAKEESDYTTDNFLQWFVQEQLEEVSSMQDLLNVVQRAGEGNLLLVEEHLARKSGRTPAVGGNPMT